MRLAKFTKIGQIPCRQMENVAYRRAVLDNNFLSVTTANLISVLFRSYVK